MTNINRRTFSAQLCAAAAVPGLALMPTTSAHADPNFPNRPIRLIVPFTAGSPPDVMGRYVGERLAKKLGQPVVVDNKPGASTSIGTQAFTSSAPDGYSWLYTVSATYLINPSVYPKLPYKVTDLQPVLRTLAIPLVIVVNAASPFKDINELIQATKAKPGVYTYASYGVGQANHVVMAHFANSVGMKINHVPYKDGGLNDLVGGYVDMSCSTVLEALPYIRAGRLRALAVSSRTRLDVLPSTPSMSDLLPGFDGDSWQALFALKGTPQPIFDMVSKATMEILDSEEYRKYLLERGLVPVKGTPSSFAEFLTTDSTRWSKIIKDNNIVVE